MRERIAPSRKPARTCWAPSMVDFFWHRAVWNLFVGCTGPEQKRTNREWNHRIWVTISFSKKYYIFRSFTCSLCSFSGVDASVHHGRAPLNGDAVFFVPILKVPIPKVECRLFNSYPFLSCGFVTRIRSALFCTATSDRMPKALEEFNFERTR